MSEDSAQLNSLLKDARLPDHQEVLMVVQGFPPLAVSNFKWVFRCWRRTSLPSGTTAPGTEQ